MDLMNEIMSENEPGKENPEDIQLLDVSLHDGRVCGSGKSGFWELKKQI